jgi:protocatechuate 3,4-dioxygenase beta subunit
MKRKDFLRGIGLASIGTALAPQNALANNPKLVGGPLACTLIPTETEGPFPLDLTANTAFFRKNIQETKTGVALNVKIKVIGSSNCLPMQNVRVNIWHCDKDGIYSGYNNAMNAGSTTATYCRGYQFTDANGIAEMNTIFPGWYNGRICHIHFKVTVSSAYAAVSQLTFPIAAKNALLLANPTLYPKGADPATFAGDNVFSDGVAFQTATLTQNAAGGYDTYLEVTVNGAGTTGIGHLEKETAKQFNMAQNFPNPFDKQTTIPFKLINGSEVKIDLYDLMGKNVATVLNKKMDIGEHQCLVNFEKQRLPVANYMYQIEVSNSDGVFKDVKMMTAF